MVLKLFEFLEQFMIEAYLVTRTHFEKTGSIGKRFIQLGNLNNKRFETRSRSYFHDSYNMEFAFLLTKEVD